MKRIAVIAVLLFTTTGCRAAIEEYESVVPPADPGVPAPTVWFEAQCERFYVTADGWPEGTTLVYNIEAEDGFPGRDVAGHWDHEADTRFISPQGGYTFRFVFTLPSGESQSFGGKSPAGCPPAASYPPDPPGP